MKCRKGIYVRPLPQQLSSQCCHSSMEKKFMIGLVFHFENFVLKLYVVPNYFSETKKNVLSYLVL